MYIDLTLSIDIQDPIIAKASADPDSYMSRGHIGTHLDVYGGQAFPPPHYCMRRGLLIDARDAGEEIGLAILAGRELQAGDFLIFHTGHLARHVYGSRPYYQTQPKFSWDLVEHLAERDTGFIGLDFPGMRSGPEHNTADRIVGSRGGYVIENLANVDRLHAEAGDRTFLVCTGWTGFQGSTGLSCRVVAHLD